MYKKYVNDYELNFLLKNAFSLPYIQCLNAINKNNDLLFFNKGFFGKVKVFVDKFSRTHNVNSNELMNEVYILFHKKLQTWVKTTYKNNNSIKNYGAVFLKYFSGINYFIVMGALTKLFKPKQEVLGMDKHDVEDDSEYFFQIYTKKSLAIINKYIMSNTKYRIKLLNYADTQCVLKLLLNKDFMLNYRRLKKNHKKNDIKNYLKYLDKDIKQLIDKYLNWIY